ncbi:5829_t:CDS:2, partial [Dentiscutata erythropus]
MSIEIATTLTLNQFQTALGLILNIAGLTWTFLLTNAVKVRMLNQFVNDHEVPILEAIVPTNIMDAQITNDFHRSAYGSYAEVSTMMQRRNKSGVPGDILVGQIPLDPRWKFNTRLDVDPYPWRSSCSLYRSGVIQTNMNTSVLNLVPTIIEAFPEVHAEYKFRNSPDGYNYTKDNYESFKYYNTTNSEEYRANGAFIVMMEEFTRGNDSDIIGFEYINRLWTLRVPEAFRILYNPDNVTEFEIILVPVVVKAYTCKVERVKVGQNGSYNLLGRFIDADVDVAGVLTGRIWTLAVINGHDTSIYEYNPDHWSSFLSTKDTQTASIENVPVQITTSCISIHPVYFILMGAYIIMLIIGCLFRRKIRKGGLKAPDTTVGWAILACKANDYRNLSNYKLKKELTDD